MPRPSIRCSTRSSTSCSQALSTTTPIWRRDCFFYDKANERSETMNFIGGTIKGGANCNIDRHNNVFFNAGYISRAPFFSGGVFLNSAKLQHHQSGRRQREGCVV